MVSKKTLDVLMFDMLLIEVSRFCISDDTLVVMRKKYPLVSKEDIIISHAQVKEMMLVLKNKRHDLHVESLPSCKLFFSSLGKRIFSEEELGRLYVVLLHISHCAQWVKESFIEDGITNYHTNIRLRMCMIPQHVFSLLSQIFNNTGELDRKQIKELRIIDNKKFAIHKRRKQQAHLFINNNRDWCIADEPTLYLDRIVLGIKKPYKSQVEGILHGNSGSEKSVFIEIPELYHLNNEMEMICVEEKKIIYKICKDLSEAVCKSLSSLQKLYDAFIEFDCAYAQAQYGIKNDSSLLCFNINASQCSMTPIELYGIRHPLVRDAQPIDIVMNNKTLQLALTGPNEGGKTFALKTLGLAILMNQSAIPVLVEAPCVSTHMVERESRLPFFCDVYAVIGDNQNIIKGHSTFSSHISDVHGAITSVEKSYHYPVILLFDEFCGGTDDREGGALAWAILEYLHNRNVYTVLTTHLAIIKHYALTHDHIQIAAIEPENNYNIVYGAIGVSEAVKAARRAGISVAILSKYKKVMNLFGKNYDSLLQEIQKTYQKAKRVRDKNIEKEKMITNELQLLEEKKRILAKQEYNFYHNTMQEGYPLLNKMRKKFEQLTAELAGMHKNKEKKTRENTTLVNEFRTSVKCFETSIKQLQLKSEQYVHAMNLCALKEGDIVTIIDSNVKGVIIRRIKKNTYQVRAGIIMLELSREKLVYKQDLAKHKLETQSFDKDNMQSNFRLEQKENKALYQIDGVVLPSFTIDVRGCSVEEALSCVDAQLNRAIISRIKCFSIIHGKGMHTLMRAIHEEMKKHPYVKEIKQAAPSDGGSGKTYVHLL